MSHAREELASAIGAIAARLLGDPDVIRAVHAFARLLDESRTPPDGTGPITTVAPQAPTSEPAAEQGAESGGVEPRTPSVAPSRREPLRPLTLGQPRHPMPRSAHSGDPAEDSAAIDLGTIVERCRLKAEATRRAAERRRRSEVPADFEERVGSIDRDLQDRAHDLPGCSLWMSHPASNVAADPERAAELALAFEVVALSAELLQVLRDDEASAPLLTDALHLVAEAQSALRVLVESAGHSKDGDQYGLYSYLREVGAEHQIYIRRYMKLEDPADPARLPDLRALLLEFKLRIERDRGVGRERRKLLSKLKYHSRVLRDGGGTDADRRKVVEVAAQLVAGGLPPSTPEIRDHVEPVLGELSHVKEVPREFELVRREADHHRLFRSRPVEAASEPERPTAEVLEVASLLRGRSIVLICNVVNPEARDALVRAFDLAELDWIVAREHQSIERFKPNIARPEVALVLLTIRWSSHSFGDLKGFCDDLGKPFVQLPGGYNVNQVASQILTQASRKLRAGAEAAAV